MPLVDARSRVNVDWMLLGAILAGIVMAMGCSATPRIGEELRRRGDEIVVAGRFFHTGAPVVLWCDPGGYDGYRVERRFVPLERASWQATTRESSAIETPNRFGLRDDGLTTEELERVRGGGWDLELLRRRVDLFVIHYDVSGTSRRCFQTLHDERGLSCHFLIDLDGTIYQTLDVKERAWHAGPLVNDRSVGVELANVGAWPVGEQSPIDRWYVRDEHGPRVRVPPEFGDGGVRTIGFIARPIRPEPVVGTANGQTLRQYDFTPEQYAALAKLTATLHAALPLIELTLPKNEHGDAIATGVMSPEQIARHRGLIGHLHISAVKHDPGPAFQWERVVREAHGLAR